MPAPARKPVSPTCTIRVLIIENHPNGVAALPGWEAWTPTAAPPLETLPPSALAELP